MTKKNSYEYVYEFIKNKGCELLDKEYENQDKKLYSHLLSFLGKSM